MQDVLVMQYTSLTSVLQVQSRKLFLITKMGKAKPSSATRENDKDILEFPSSARR